MTPMKILVPLDGSTLAESALPKATELARMYGGTVMLLRATEAHLRAGHDLVDAQIRVVREAEGYLDVVADRLRTAGCQTVTTSVWYGEPATSIVDAAKFNGVGMIVMTTHGRTGFGRLLVGSVTESVLRGTSTPVLVLHPDGAPVETPVGAGQPAR